MSFMKKKKKKQPLNFSLRLEQNAPQFCHPVQQHLDAYGQALSGCPCSSLGPWWLLSTLHEASASEAWEFSLI